MTSLKSVIEDPVLSLKEEWLRDDKWKDRNGEGCSAREEWEYVMGSAGSDVARGTGFGKRDEGHEGWTPEQFMETANKQDNGYMFQIM